MKRERGPGGAPAGHSGLGADRLAVVPDGTLRRGAGPMDAEGLRADRGAGQGDDGAAGQPDAAPLRDPADL